MYKFLQYSRLRSSYARFLRRVADPLQVGREIKDTDQITSNPGLLQLRHWQSDALTTWLDHHYSAISHPHSAISHPHPARSHPHSARSHPHSARSHPHSARSHSHSARSHSHSARSHPSYLHFFTLTLIPHFPNRFCTVQQHQCSLAFYLSVAGT